MVMDEPFELLFVILNMLLNRYMYFVLKTPAWREGIYDIYCAKLIIRFVMMRGSGD